MVFFTSILIVATLYYLQADGLIYVTVIAVVAELINIFLTQTLTKSVEKKANANFGKIITRHKSKIAAQEKTIKELEDIREASVKNLHDANLKIKEYEEKLSVQGSDDSKTGKPEPIQPEIASEEKNFDDLPPGSNRKQLPL